jgi:AcrR family transcriptional regulator
MNRMKRSREEKGQQRALQVAKTAARLFNRKGYLETSMEDIASGAGMSKGGVYHYFSSKEEILYFVLSNYMDIILEGLEKELQETRGDAAKIKIIISRHIRLYTQNLWQAKTLLHDANCLSRRRFAKIAKKERQYYRMVSQVLRDLFGNRMSDEKLTVTTFLLFGMCNWIYSWYQPKGAVAPEELSGMIYDIFMQGAQNLTEKGPRQLGDSLAS